MREEKPMKLDLVIAKRNNKTLYRDDNSLVKVFDESTPNYDVFKEVLNHTSVENTSINVPDLLEVTRVDGKWVIASKFISGKTLDELINENPEKKNEYLEVLVNVQMQIHSNSTNRLTPIKEILHDKIRLTDYNATTRYELHSDIDAMPRSSTVCHGNLIPSSVIVADSGEYYVVSWAHATRGYFLADVATTYLLLLINGNEEGANVYLDLYASKSGIEKAVIENLIPTMAATLICEYEEDKKEILLSLVNKAY
jgi:hypothetical protein